MSSTVEGYLAAACSGYLLGDARGAAIGVLLVFLGRLLCRLVFSA